MSTNDRGTEERIATDDPFAHRVTGPHWASEEHGADFYSFFECRECGAQSVDRGDLLGCCSR